MAITKFEDNLDNIIHSAIKSRTDEFVRGRIEEVKKELDRMVPEITAGIVVDVMKMTEMRILQDRIVFTIRKID